MQSRTYASLRVSKVLVCLLLLLSASVLSMHKHFAVASMARSPTSREPSLLERQLRPLNNGTGVSVQRGHLERRRIPVPGSAIGHLHHQRDRVGIQARKGELLFR